MKIKVLIYCILAVLTAQMFATPQWFNKYRQLYNQDEQIVGLGFADTYENALSNAKADLIQQISVNVEVNTITELISVETESKAFFSESVSRAIKSSSDLQLQGMEILRQETKDNQTYVMISLNKKILINNLSNEVSKIFDDIQSLIANAQNHFQKGNFILALESYNNALEQIPVFITQRTLHDNLTNRPYNTQKNISVSDINTHIRNIIGSIKFEVIKGNQQVSKIGMLLPEPVIFKASARVSGGEFVSLINLPVQVRYGDGTLIEKGLTDTNGNYLIFVNAFPERGDRGKLSIHIDYDKFSPYLRNTLKNLSGEAYYRTLETNPIYISLTVIDDNNNPLEQTKRQLIRVFTNSNVFHNDNATVLVRGKATIDDMKTIEGMGAPKYLTSASVDLEFISKSTGSLIGSLKGTGKGMSDKNEQDAKDKAYSNLSLNSRELRVLLTQIEANFHQDTIKNSIENLNKGKEFFLAKDYQNALVHLLRVQHNKEAINEARQLITDIRNNSYYDPVTEKFILLEEISNED